MFVSTHEVVPQPASRPTTPRGWRCPRQVSRLWAPGRVPPWHCWCSQGFVAAGDLLEPWNDINGKAYINLHLYQRILAQMYVPQTESMETLAPSPSAPQPTSFPRCPCTIRKRHSMPAASRAILFSLMASCDTRSKLSKETYLERFLILLIYWFSVLFSIKGHVPLEIVQFLACRRDITVWKPPSGHGSTKTVSANAIPTNHWPWARVQNLNSFWLQPVCGCVSRLSPQNALLNTKNYCGPPFTSWYDMIYSPTRKMIYSWRFCPENIRFAKIWSTPKPYGLKPRLSIVFLH